MKQLALASWVLTSACNEHFISATDDVPVVHAMEDVAQWCIREKRLDILVVIDDSASMAEGQMNLAANMRNFGELLEIPEFKYTDVRVAFTTTSVSNPFCTTTTAADGAFQDSSCRTRLVDFVSAGGGEGPATDESRACRNTCALDQLGLLPTVAGVDGTPRVRPWLAFHPHDAVPGAENLPAGVSLSELVPCLALPGIGGCEYESPLEAMYRALRRSADGRDPAFQFVRPDADLFVVIFTDEADCSAADTSVLDPAGLRKLWADAAAGRADSGVCWRAGVACQGDGRPFDECHTIDRAADATLTSPEQAVLHPVSRYIDYIDAIEADKQARDPRLWVGISVVTGVPHGFADGSEDLSYWWAGDPDHLEEFGIAAGCTGFDEIQGNPPVRLLEFGESQTYPDHRNLFSICKEDLTDAFEPIFQTILPQARPWCFRRCAADMDPGQPSLQPECRVEQKLADGSVKLLAECMSDHNGYLWHDDRYVLPAGEKTCYAMLVDADSSTGDEHDDLEQECRDESWNLQFKLTGERRGSCLHVVCALSSEPDLDCPER